MNVFDDIRDDQIRIVGHFTCEDDGNKKQRKRKKVCFFYSIIIFIILLCLIIWGIFKWCKDDAEYDNQSEKYYLEQVNGNMPLSDGITIEEYSKILEKEKDIKYLKGESDIIKNKPALNVENFKYGFTEIKDTIINDIHIKIFIPHNAVMSLHIGDIDKNDTTIVYAAQAADIRADNGKIVGAFVLKGEPLAWGISKKGYCAQIDGKVSIGVAENSPHFEEATKKGGYFFRQYPLVSNGRLIENEPKGKSIRRAICDRNGEIFMVQTMSRESFHDFAQALVDMNVAQAIYLVGSTAYGWAVDEEGTIHEFGEKIHYDDQRKITRNINYMVWKKR